MLERDCRFVDEVNAFGVCKPYEKIFLRRDGTLVPAIIGGARLIGLPGQVIVFALDISSIEQTGDLSDKLGERLSMLSRIISGVQDDLVLRGGAEESLGRRLEEFHSLAERLSLARHQEAQQVMHLLAEGLQHLFDSAFHNSLLKCRRHIRHANAMTADIVSHAINASHSLSAELTLSVLREGGFVPTLKNLARTLQDRYRLEVSLTSCETVEQASNDVKVMILQGVRELLMNVVEHSEVNSARVTAVRSGKYIQIEVEDSGAGFDPNRLNDKNAAGGLAILSERVRNLEGQLQVFSAPGLGTRCRMILPCTWETERLQPGMPAAQIAQETVGETAGKRIHVMLVDDHTVIRQGIISLLRMAPDLEIVGEASDGESALQMARDIKPDVVLMDVCMPGMGGVQATKLLHNEMPQVRVIGLSMLEERDMALLMREAGAVGYLTKNGPTDEMVSAIRACI
jgi:CheY-like chemotaxis protein